MRYSLEGSIVQAENLPAGWEVFAAGGIVGEGPLVACLSSNAPDSAHVSVICEIGVR